MKVQKKQTDTSTQSKEMLSVSDLARFFGVAYNTAWALTHQPGFPVCIVGRMRFVHRDALLRWIDSTSIASR